MARAAWPANSPRSSMSRRPAGLSARWSSSSITPSISRSVCRGMASTDRAHTR